MQPPEPRIHRSHVQAGWRVTVPAAVRLYLGIGTGDRVEFLARDGVVEIRRGDDQGGGAPGAP